MRHSAFVLLCSCLCALLTPALAQTSSDSQTPSDSQSSAAAKFGRLAGKLAYRKVEVPADVMAGMLLQKTDPVYPPVARAARIQGIVVLQAAISKSGSVEDLHVVTGQALLQDAALSAVRTWRYRPYLVNGEPVKVQTTINVVFTLSVLSAAPAAPAPAAPAPAETAPAEPAPAMPAPAALAPAAPAPAAPAPVVSAPIVPAPAAPAPAAPAPIAPAPIAPAPAAPAPAAPAPAAPAPAAQPVKVAEVELPTPVIDAAAQSETYEFAAWEATLKAANPSAYKTFYQRFPNTTRLKVVPGTLRARYWFKVAQPFGDDGKHRDGVFVTVDGMNFAINLSLEEAINRGVIGVTPAAPDANPDSQGRTFKRIYFEATEGGVLVGNQIITPKDNLNSTLFLSADGSQLLAWDLSKSTPDAHPSTEPTMTQDSDGNYACGQACP
jgi:TonB family protein